MIKYLIDDLEMEEDKFYHNLELNAEDYAEDHVDDYIDEKFGRYCEVAGMTYYTAIVLKAIDEDAYENCIKEYAETILANAKEDLELYGEATVNKCEYVILDEEILDDEDRPVTDSADVFVKSYNKLVPLMNKLAEDVNILEYHGAEQGYGFYAFVGDKTGDRFVNIKILSDGSYSAVTKLFEHDRLFGIFNEDVDPEKAIDLKEIISYVNTQLKED